MDSEPAVGVGSIAHILKTAFKSVYDEEQLMKDATQAAEDRRILNEEARAIQAVKLAAIAEAEGAAKAKADVKKDKKNSVAKGATLNQSPYTIEAPILGKGYLM